jgi:hypothetical protein
VLSYAQSYSLIEFLVTSYGQSKMLELLTAFSQGSSYDGALKKVYGFDMDGLNTLWRAYAFKHYQVASPKTASMPPVFIRLIYEMATDFDLNLRLASSIGAEK